MELGIGENLQAFPTHSICSCVMRLSSLSLVSSRYGFPWAAASASVTTSTGILFGPAKRSTLTGETAVTTRIKARWPALENFVRIIKVEHLYMNTENPNLSSGW